MILLGDTRVTVTIVNSQYLIAGILLLGFAYLAYLVFIKGGD